MQNFLLSEERTKSRRFGHSFFLGPSLAITDWLPENLQNWKDRNPEIQKVSLFSTHFTNLVMIG